MYYKKFEDIGFDKMQADEDDIQADEGGIQPDLGGSELAVLNCITDSPGISEDDIAKKLGLSLSEVQEIVDYLLAQDYISLD